MEERAVEAAAAQLARDLAAPFPVTQEREQRMRNSLVQLDFVNELLLERGQAGAGISALPHSVARALARLAQPLATFADSAATHADLAGDGTFAAAAHTALNLQMNRGNCMAAPEGAQRGALYAVENKPLALAVLWSASQATKVLLALSSPSGPLPAQALADAPHGPLGSAALVRWMAEAAQVANQVCTKHGASAVPLALVEVMSILAGSDCVAEALQAAPVCQLAVVRLLARLISDPSLLKSVAAPSAAAAGSSGQQQLQQEAQLGGHSGHGQAAEAVSRAARQLVAEATRVLCYGYLQEGRQRWKQVALAGQQLLPRAVALTRLLPDGASVLRSRAIDIHCEASTECLMLEATAVNLVAVLLLDDQLQAVASCPAAAGAGSSAAAPQSPHLDPASADAMLEAVPCLYSLVAAAAGITDSAADSASSSLDAVVFAGDSTDVSCNVHGAICSWVQVCLHVACSLEPLAFHTPAACQAAAAAAEALLRMGPLLPQLPFVPLHTGSEPACRPAGSSSNVVTGEIATPEAFGDLVSWNPPQCLALVSPAIVTWLLQSVANSGPGAGGASDDAAAQQGAAAGGSLPLDARQHSARQSLAAASNALWAAAMSACKHLWAAPQSPFASSTAAHISIWHDPGGDGEPGIVMLHACKSALLALLGAIEEGEPDAQRHLECLVVCFTEALCAPAFTCAASAEHAGHWAHLAAVTLVTLFEAPQLKPLLLACGTESGGRLRDVVIQVSDTVNLAGFPPEEMQAIHEALSQLISGLPSTGAAVTALGAEQLPADGELAVRRARALALRPCANPRCLNMSGASEAELRGKRCSGCRIVRFCCPECSKAEWRQHKVACRLLAADREG